MTKQKVKKKLSKKIMIITIIIVICLIAGIVGFLFLGKKDKKQEKVKDYKFEEEWQTTYYNFLKEDLYGDQKKKEENIKKYPGYATLNLKERKNPKIAFIDVGTDTPYLIVTSERNTKDKDYNVATGPFERIANVGIFYIDKTKKNNIARIMQGIEIGDKYQILYLYDKEEKKYDWYLVREESAQPDYKIKVFSIREFVEISNRNSKKEDAKEHEMIPEYRYNSFDDIKDRFIIIEENEIKLKSITETIKEKDFASFVKNRFDEYQSPSKLVTEKVKEKIEQIEKEENIAKEKEQQKQQEQKEEEKTTTNNNNNTQSNQSPSTFKVGAYNVKFGRYEWKMDTYIHEYFTLNPDYTCSYTDNDGNTSACTFSVGRATDGQDISSAEEKDAIIFKISNYTSSYFPKENGFRDTDMQDFVYIGN